MGERLRLLRLEVRPHRFHGGFSRRGKKLRHPGLRALPRTMATHWGAWSPEERRGKDREEAPRTKVLPPEEVAAFIAWLCAAPPEFVLTEGIITPVDESLP